MLQPDPCTTMPNYQYIILEKDPVEHIARLTINRPDRRNALHDDATDEMGQAIDDVAADDDIRVLVLTGAGDAFCAGGDLNA
ncbi:MAG: enoyl-CoA hydratase/isomerase family protein, partial [Chloroflexota bacterium]|nr:enoyl-CoA hydratase/isomerase family protein [Chloroflexota bacterium]